MVAVSPVSQSAGISEFASGKFTGDGTAAVVTLGFTPRYIQVYNETDVITWEKFEGQPDANSHKTVAAGTKTADTGSAIVIGTKSFTISTGAAPNGKVLYWNASA